MALALGAAVPQVAAAQSVLGNLIDGLRSGGSSGALSSAVSSLVGTSTVSQSSLVGTWSYTGPAIVFRSSNVANQLGGALAAASVESRMAEALGKVGLQSGKLKVTFKADKTYTCVLNGRTVSGTYAVSGSTLTLTKKGMRPIKTNVKLTGKELQVSIEADKLLALASAVGSNAGGSSSFSTLTSLMKSFDGVNLGLKFSK